MPRTDAPISHRGPDTRTKLENPETNRKGTKISHSFQAITIGVCSVQEIIRPQIVHNNDKLQPLTVLLVVQVLHYTKMHLTPHIHLFILTHNHQPHIVNLPCMYKHQRLTVTLPHFHLIYTKLLSHQLHRIIEPVITTPINNKCTQPFNAQLPQSFNPHVPPPYFPQYPPTNSASAHSTDSSILLALQKQWERQERLDMERNQMEKQKEERKRMKEEREQRKEDRKQVEKHENQQRSRINKAFEKIPRFDGTNPSYCFDWSEQTEALVNEHQGQIYREELLLNCGTSMSKTIHALPQGATNQNIKDAVLRNHSNLRTMSQRSNAYHQLHQKPDEALQTYNTRYASFFNLAYPELELDNPLSRMHCIHYALSLYGKLRDEMTGRFNQDLPENLQTAFKKAMNFKPRIITKQSINNRKINKVNHIDIGHEDEVEINEAHVRNLNNKGKNYNQNYAQNRSKMTNTTNNTSNHQNNTTQSYGSSSQHNNSNPGYGYNKSNQQEKPVNVSVTLHGPVSKEQLYKIQEVLTHPSQYRDRIKPEDHPVKGKYANAFNKFHPKKVEVNEATVEEAIKYGHFLKKSKEDMAEAIDIYKTLGNETFYGPEIFFSSIHTSAPRQLDCFTIALGKKTGTTFPITFDNKHNYNALYDTGTGASLINYSAYVSLGQDLDTGYQPFIKNASGEDMGALGQVTCTFTINNQPFTQSFIVCRHMQQPIILGTDFTSTNFVRVIWTHESTRKMIRSNGSTVKELPDTTSGVPLVLARSIKIRPGGNLEVLLECTRQLTDQMDIRIDTGFHHKNPNIYIPPSCINNPNNKYNPRYMPLTIFNLSTIDHLYIGKDTVIAFAEQPVLETYNIELASEDKIKEHLPKPRNWVPQRHKTLPEIPHDTAFICSPADVPGPRKVQLQDKDIATNIRQKFEELCKEYGEAFSKNNEDIGRTKLVKMDIDTGDSPPVSSRPYTLPLNHYEWVQREIEFLERAGVITKSMSKWASPIVIVPKKSAPGEPPKRRLCVDFRKVNELQQEVITVGKTKGQISIHPLPKIDEMYVKLKGAKVFSTIDLRSGYHHIALGKSSRAKIAFVMPFGKYEFLMVPFGLAQAPAYFQLLMNKVLKGLKFAMMYLDDIIIFSQDELQHLEHLEIVFSCLWKLV